MVMEIGHASLDLEDGGRPPSWMKNDDDGIGRKLSGEYIGGVS